MTLIEIKYSLGDGKFSKRQESNLSFWRKIRQWTTRRTPGSRQFQHSRWAAVPPSPTARRRKLQNVPLITMDATKAFWANGICMPLHKTP